MKLIRASHIILNRRMRYPKMSSQARIKTLQKAPSNGWIAFSEDEEHLIAYGATYDEVVANAEKQGVADLVVVKVPETRIYRVRRG
jgi:predicted RNase H-like HicB family nuclease